MPPLLLTTLLAIRLLKFAAMPLPPLLMALMRSTREWAPRVTPAAPMPRMVPPSTVAASLSASATMPLPAPFGVHVNGVIGGVPEQTVGPRMAKPFRSMVTFLAVTRIAVVLSSTVRSPVRR